MTETHERRLTKHERAGLWFAGAEILAVGLVPAFSTYAVARIDPLTYSAAAVSVAAIVAAGIAALRGELRTVFTPPHVYLLLPIAFLGTTLTTLFLFFGARLTDGVSTALLLQFEPLVSLALAWLIWRRTVPARQGVGIALAVAGVALVLYDGSLRVGAGGLLIILATLFWQLSHLLALRVMPPLSVYSLAAARYLYGGAALVLVRIVFGRGLSWYLGGQGIAMALFHGVVLFYLGTIFWYETINRLDLPRATAIVAPSEPLIAVLMVWMLLGTVPNAWQIAGFALLAPGLWLLVSSPSKA